ncbi:MAG: hypothetical protein B6U72_06370 [Candidatus Altiarchaeales archaeon ex4484_2]|nr:MAG: hypothetical protein B6U72_06370 [Candidatus Altiarchaeales archaeon ex4484_2]
METTPFYITLSAIILFLTAALVLPAYGDWAKVMDEKKAVEETERIVNAIESVSSLGDVGSTQHLKLNIPGGYKIDVRNHSINLSEEGREVVDHDIKHLELRYHGSRQLEGNINLTVTHWLRGENFTEEKEYFIEVIR